MGDDKYNATFKRIRSDHDDNYQQWSSNTPATTSAGSSKTSVVQNEHEKDSERPKHNVQPEKPTAARAN